jgi:catechol 2,3-dioxygenase-like lactoylglutathione lyase family enzyme
MATALQFDHVVILVNDLEKVSREYQALGFNVFFGGAHADGKTHSSLIVFGDGTYLELLAPTSPALLDQLDPSDKSSFLFIFARGEGFGGFALLSSNLERDVARMQQRGLAIHLRPAGGRARPDGQVLRWRSAMLDGTMTPFFIQDDTPRNLRVPDDADKIQHPRGVTGVAGIMVAVADLDEGIRRYSAILDRPPQQQDATTADFALGDKTISLSAPALADEESNLYDYLTQHGQVPYKLWLWSARGAAGAGALYYTWTHGADIELMG